MNKISRRDALKGLAVLPMAATPGRTQSTSAQQAVSNQPACSSQDSQVSIRFHGVWAFIVLPTHITAVTPCVEEHSYWLESGNQIQHLLRGKYHLEGVPQATAPFTPTEAVIHGIENVEYARTYMWISMPLPKAMTASGLSAVGVSFTEVSNRQCQNVDPCKPQPFTLSTTHLFQYDRSGTGPLLNPSSGSFKDCGEFHVRAELMRGPNETKDIRHLYRAVELLIALFPKLDMRPLLDSTKTGSPRATDACGAQFSVQP